METVSQANYCFNSSVFERMGNEILRLGITTARFY